MSITSFPHSWQNIYPKVISWRWSAELGYLPTRSSALQNWANPDEQEFVGAVVASAELLPPAEVLTSLGPPISSAAVEVLKASSDPISAAQEAAASLNSP